MSPRPGPLPASAAAFAAALVVLGAAPMPARAQLGGQPGPGGLPGPQQPGEEPKEEGPAEEAPEEAERPSDLEPLSGYAYQSRFRRQIIELEGYSRLRTDFMHNFFLGQRYFENEGISSPFPRPLECQPTANRAATGACDKNHGAGNLRLRLEPTINVTDQVRVMAQVDVLDNTIAGSTPDSFVGFGDPPTGRTNRAPAPALYNTQYPPEVGQNGYLSSIRAKRAWAEVQSEFGTLSFGRMPWRFGRGILFNDGGCPDCDDGTTVDRIMARTRLYGHEAALSWDFGAQGLTSGMVRLGRDDPQGYPLDLSQRDDVFQLMGAITRIDEPEVLRERLDRGDFVVNYGAQLVFRRQEDDVVLETMPTPGGQTPPPINPDDFSAGYTRAVNALLFLPDLWLKLAFRGLTVEMEATAVLGKMDRAGPLAVNPDQSLTLRQIGWVVASELRLYRDAFFVGLETGGATGDSAENPNTYLNYRWKFVPQPETDNVRITDFRFSPDYHVDEIFFRRILGTVTNAIYVKPKIAYWLDLEENRKLGLSGAFIYSTPMVLVATPGNAHSYGLEMNLGVNYRNTSDGFFAGITWGVFWPLGALNRPDLTRGNGTPLWPVAEDATAAQVLRTFLGVRF